MPATPSEAYLQCCNLLLTIWEDDPTATWSIEHVDGATTIDGVKIQWPNVEDSVDRDRITNTDKLNPWAQYFWMPATSRQTNVGRNALNRFEHTGTITLQINVPVGEGLFLATALATMAAKAYRAVSTSGGVFFKNPRTQVIGNVHEGSVFRVDFLTDFQFDEVA